MPIDYKKYPPNWKSEIRPAILLRANQKCEQCNVPNYSYILRGTINGIECYQLEDGALFRADNSEHIGYTYVGDVHPSNKFIKVVLTISHIDHDINNNDHKNLKALCQKCHLNHDKEHHAATRRKTKEDKKGLISIF